MSTTDIYHAIYLKNKKHLDWAVFAEAQQARNFLKGSLFNAANTPMAVVAIVSSIDWSIIWGSKNVTTKKIELYINDLQDLL